MDAAGGSSEVALSSDVVGFLADMGRIDEETAALLASTRPDAAASPSDVATLLARTDLHARSVELAGLLDERAALANEIAATEASLEELRIRVARLESEELAVMRRLDGATAAFESLRALEPALAFVADLTPSNTRVLNAAQEPVEPSGPSALLVAVLAAVVGLLAGTVFVFLREAVRDPSTVG